MRILKRIGNVLEGLVFIVVSLCLQSIFVIMLTMAVLLGLSAIGLHIESKIWGWGDFRLTARPHQHAGLLGIFC